MKMIIAGGRKYQEQPGDRDFLDAVAQKFGVTEVLSGGSEGADTLGEHWAIERGIPVNKCAPN